MTTISALSLGSKLVVRESDDTTATYTLVHHGYGSDALCLLWRDECLNETIAFNDNNDSFHIDLDGKLDAYLNETFFEALPETTRKLIRPAIYPTVRSRANTEIIQLERYVCTPSAREQRASMGSQETHDAQLQCLDTISIGQPYWTRSIYTSATSTAFRVGETGELYQAARGYPSGIRPCFCVDETQIVENTSDSEQYVMLIALPAPDQLKLNGQAENLVDLQRDIAYSMSWKTLSEYPVEQYEVWARIDDGEYQCYASYPASFFSGEASILAEAPSKGSTTIHFRVRAIAQADSEYADSELSDDVRSVSTKRTNVHYYTGTKWVLAVPNVYNGGWIASDGLHYYDGETWITPD